MNNPRRRIAEYPGDGGPGTKPGESISVQKALGFCHPIIMPDFPPKRTLFFPCHSWLSRPQPYDFHPLALEKTLLYVDVYGLFCVLWAKEYTNWENEAPHFSDAKVNVKSANQACYCEFSRNSYRSWSQRCTFSLGEKPSDRTGGESKTSYACVQIGIENCGECNRNTCEENRGQIGSFSGKCKYGSPFP